MIGAIVGAVAQRRAGQDAANATKDAARMSSEAELTATREAIAAQERTTNQARRDNSTWMQPADRGLATLQSLIYGEPVDYKQKSYLEGITPRPTMPTPPQGVADPGPRSTTSEPEYLNVLGQNPDGTWMPSNGEEGTYQVVNPNYKPGGGSAEWDKQSADYNKYVQDMAAYELKDAVWQASPEGGNAGAKTETANAPKFELPPNFDGSKYAFDGSKYAFNFDPSKIKDDPGYQWEKQRGLEDLRTQLMLSGRPGGTVAANATGRFLGDLNASYDDKYYNRQYGENQQNYGRAMGENTLAYGRGLGENTLAYDRVTGERSNYQNQLSNLLNLARGAQSQVTGAELSGANNTSSALMNQGNTLASIYGNQGRTLADISMYQGQNAAQFGRGMDNSVKSIVSSILTRGMSGSGGSN